ncbi:MAG TPA: glycoside hydrolase family 16 protein [Terriglobia bacterium]|nr:glycoside hydrolase family 16 protein [Terriglobia bacterium]
MAALLMLLVATLASAQAPELPGWKLVWSDEYNYTGHPDPEKWGYEEGYVRHNDIQYYTMRRLENARVDGKNLLIELRMETSESFLPTSLNDEWHRYTSASLTTRDTASWTYGRFEIRAKMPRGKGTWPAIWFLSPLRTPNVPGPPRPRQPDGKEVQGSYRGPNNGESSEGEIDLMESWGSHPNEIAVHIHGTKGPTPSTTVAVDDLYDKFHVYALEWYRDHMDFFLDGRKILTYTKDPATGWAFDHPMYLIMNVACGGPDEPAPDNSRLPQFMTVDYVRVYQQTASGLR